MKYFLILLIVYVFATGCKKELSLENQAPAKVERKFQLKAFYSDIPIDFIQTDGEIKHETNLWSYVNEYLKDDVNIFADGDTLVQVYQNANKKPGLDDALLNKSYHIFTDANGTFMKFLGPEYEPLLYTLNELNDQYFLLSLKWVNGSTVYSRFERVY